MSPSALTPEQALTRRWLRDEWLPLDTWRWLAGQPVKPTVKADPVKPSWMPMLQSFLEPLAGWANQHQRQSLADSLLHMSSLFVIVAERGRGAGRACHERMLAASLLPLYRGLAGGRLDEISSVMRYHLAETMTLVALGDELGEDFGQLLALGLTRDQVPHELTRAHLDIELERLSQLLLACAGGWSGECTVELSKLTKKNPYSDRRPAWGQPAILWRLAGQLLADRAEFMVPRDWIDVPVPWQQVSDHWRAIAHELQRHQTGTPHLRSSNLNTASLLNDRCRTIATAPFAYADDSEPVTHSDPCPTRANLDRAALSIDRLAADSTATPETDTTGAAMMQSSLSLELDIAGSVASLVQTTAAALPDRFEAQPVSLPNGDSGCESPIPKMVIAEIRSHNDPAFVAEIRRLLAICRSEDRTVSLMAIRVQASGDSDDIDLQTPTTAGLYVWQHQLINWLVQHPEVHQPQAFISQVGELVVCLLDIERNTATALLRQGIEDNLTGRLATGETPTALARVSAPIQYHSGIASVSSPLASLSAEQFIAATYRCMDAAERHGKACIKSIEVF